MMSGVVFPHRLWTAYMHRRCRAWHAIISLGMKTQSINVRHCIPSSPLGTIQGRMTSGVTCHHFPWPAYMVTLRGAWHSINALGQHLQSYNVWCNMSLYLWTIHTDELRQAWHAIITLKLHIQLVDLGHSMPSSR